MDIAEFAKKVFADAADLMNKVRRPVECRAKQAITKEWVYGYFAPMPFLDEQNMLQHISPAIITLDIDRWSVAPVDPETVGQYSGKDDDNGEKLFEGDIVKGLFLHGDSVLSVVAFKDGAFGLEWNKGTVKAFSAFTSICNVKYEKIGNIYDNPELLKEGVTE